jgi:AcrR family transcriptional regulator
MNSADEGRASRGPRATQKEATGRAVLNAARREFERVGFEAASLRTIAANAGVSAGTVLHHYGEKRDLLHAALFDDLNRALARGLKDLGSGPLEDQLFALAHTLFRHYQRRPRLSRTLLKESLFAEEPWAQRFSGQTATVHQAVARQVDLAIERGELRAGADGSRFAVAYLSFFYFALIAWVQGAHRDPVALVRNLVRQHLDGMRPKKPTRRRAP